MCNVQILSKIKTRLCLRPSGIRYNITLIQVKQFLCRLTDILMSYLDFYSSLLLKFQEKQKFGIACYENLKHEIEIIRYIIQIYVFSQ